MMAIGFTPTLGMMMVQISLAGLNVMSKLAMDLGLSPFVLITYRQLVATLALAPVAFFLERKTCTKITGKVLFQIFLCALFGATGNQLLYFLGLKHISATMGCALSNTLPAITFVMAIPFRMETGTIKTIAGQAKVLGTIVCVGGSILMTLYQGSSIKMIESPIHWMYVESMTMASESPAGGQNKLLGAVLVVLSSVSWAAWFIIQAKMSKSFSSPYTRSTIMLSMASLQCAAISAGVERDLSKWALSLDIRLVVVLYAGILCSGLTVMIMSWCLEMRGPLFVSMFSPLVLIIVAVLGWAILDEKLYVGSVTGSVLIIGGLYLVLWGKGRETLTTKMADVGGKPVDEELGIEGSNDHELHYKPRIACMVIDQEEREVFDATSIDLKVSNTPQKSNVVPPRITTVEELDK